MRLSSRAMLSGAAVLAVMMMVGCSSPTGGNEVQARVAPPAGTSGSSVPPGRTNAGVASRPVGLVAVQEESSKGASVFASEVYQDRSISGVAVRAEWKDLEPAADQFDWQAVDQVFNQATEANKYVVLILVPGFGTPDWALAGVTAGRFARQYGTGAGTQQQLPVPWDSTYLSRWFAFLSHVADRYGTNPAFRMIAAAGPTSVSAEMSLPNSDDDLTQWARLGYTPDRYVDAWAKTFDAYTHLFPSQYVSLALYPGCDWTTTATTTPPRATPPANASSTRASSIATGSRCRPVDSPPDATPTRAMTW